MDAMIERLGIRGLLSHVLTLLVAGSYLTLAVADTSTAAADWAPYAIVVFLLAIGNMVEVWRHRHAR